MDWYEAQKARGADIEIWWYEGAAHGMFSGPLNRQQRTWGDNDARFAWTGAEPAAREKFISDFRRFAGL
jgi:hypothetical protein